MGVQHLDYAASHGPDMADIFRKENGEWRFDLRHANVVSIE